MKNILRVLSFGVVLILALTSVASAQQDTKSEGQPFVGIAFEAADNGVTVTNVLPGSPADEAGLQTGDVITAIDGTEISVDDVAGMIQDHAVGDVITLTVERDGESLDLEVTLAMRDASPIEVRIERANMPYLGVSLSDDGDQVTIASVEAGSPAAAAGLQEGDVLVSVDDTDVSSVRQAVELIRTHEAGDTVTLVLDRNGDSVTAEVTLATLPVVPEMLSRMGGDFVIYNPRSEQWMVLSLNQDGELYQAGLRDGDAITAINIDGEAVSAQDLNQALADAADGAQATLTVERDGESMDFTVNASALESFMGMNMMFRGNGIPFQAQPVQLGVTYTMLNPEVAAAHDLSVTEGALITDVQADSPAEAAGLEVDDVITAVNGDPVDEARNLRERLLAYDPGDTITLDVLRGDQTLTLDAELAAGDNPFGNLPFDFEGMPNFFHFGPHGGFQFDIPDLPQQEVPQPQPNI
ncbi:MAG: PDZ domain-containing protein [Anaerolineae bacterium]|nr:PDZ domain-containing protein [Anaerolineae bacterium]